MRVAHGHVTTHVQAPDAWHLHFDNTLQIPLVEHGVDSKVWCLYVWNLVLDHETLPLLGGVIYAVDAFFVECRRHSHDCEAVLKPLHCIMRIFCRIPCWHIEKNAARWNANNSDALRHPLADVVQVHPHSMTSAGAPTDHQLFAFRAHLQQHIVNDSLQDAKPSEEHRHTIACNLRCLNIRRPTTTITRAHNDLVEVVEVRVDLWVA
mmetsp:Transcript_6221/g.11305  ORF Transcript_6221/g.11305 Transcript_6221/m.11305 type:complete len:207 (+) Transcript_6221:426-1046(+)